MILIRCYGDYTSWFPWKETLAVCVRVCACDVWITCSILFNLTHRSSKTSHLGFFRLNVKCSLAKWYSSLPNCFRYNWTLHGALFTSKEKFTCNGILCAHRPKHVLFSKMNADTKVTKALYFPGTILHAVPFKEVLLYRHVVFVTRAFNSRWVSDLEQVLCGQVSCLVDSLLCVVYFNSQFVHCGFCSVDKNMSNYTHNTCLPPTSLSLTLSFALIHSQSITYPFSVTNCIFIDRQFDVPIYALLAWMF